jgi:hypothetical protein
MALVNSGRNYFANAVIANPTTLFNATTATIGVGTSNAATTASMTNLQSTGTGTQKKEYNVVDSAPTIATNVLTFVATFGTGEANFSWQEWGVFNTTGGSTVGTGGKIMLNRLNENLGTKTSAQSWEITATLTVAIGT